MQLVARGVPAAVRPPLHEAGRRSGRESRHDEAVQQYGGVVDGAESGGALAGLGLGFEEVGTKDSGGQQIRENVLGLEPDSNPERSR